VTLNFDADSTQLNEEGGKALDKSIGDWVRRAKSSQGKIVVTGVIGSGGYSESRRRAYYRTVAVRNYLIDAGVDKERVTSRVATDRERQRQRRPRDRAIPGLGKMTLSLKPAPATGLPPAARASCAAWRRAWTAAWANCRPCRARAWRCWPARCCWPCWWCGRSAPIDMVVRGSGRIVASEHNQVIQHLEGGIVSAILVREGAVVKKGQTLISIADVRANADLGEGRVKILGLRAKIARLSAEASGAASLQMPADLERDDPAVQSEQAAFAARSPS
jgi:hypothetical protein